MKKYLLLSMILLACLISTQINAGQASNELGVCLTDSLTGKERKGLAKWIFFAISEHPEIKPYSNISDETKDKNNKLIGELITRLLAEDCPEKTKKALNEEGTMAINNAFKLVGEVAMQELMTNQDVLMSTAEFEKYLDKEKLEFINK
jgi:hypothetical protein